MLIYTPLTKKAIRLAFAAHLHQTDKAGLPYFYHPMEVAGQCGHEYSVCVGLLHDTVEDGHLTFDDLAREGFPPEVLEALRLLTHEEGVPYLDYVRAIRESGNPYAVEAKLADLAHNSCPGRLDELTEKDVQRLEKYRKAREILTEG